ncbi:MAG: hypothetical protein ABL997_12685 [Planctomycetota bacterium]
MNKEGLSSYLLPIAFLGIGALASFEHPLSLARDSSQCTTGVKKTPAGYEIFCPTPVVYCDDAHNQLCDYGGGVIPGGALWYCDCYDGKKHLPPKLACTGYLVWDADYGWSIECHEIDCSGLCFESQLPTGEEPVDPICPCIAS